MAKHKHGSMATQEQEQTYSGFLKAVTWLVAICVAILVFLALFAS